MGAALYYGARCRSCPRASCRPTCCRPSSTSTRATIRGCSWAPRVGEDAAVIDLGDRYLVATADPITFATDELGWYALHVNANDIAGARDPSALVPGHAAAARPARPTRSWCARSSASSPRRARSSRSRWSAVTRKSRAGIDRPIIAGTMLGEVAKDRLVTTGGAQVGDAIVLTKGVPLEGAALCWRARRRRRRSRAASGRRWSAGPGAFSAAPGSASCPRPRSPASWPAFTPCTTRPRAASPPRCTSWPRAAGVGLRIDHDRITVLPEGRALCEAFGLDPLGTLASGAS